LHKPILLENAKLTYLCDLMRFTIKRQNVQAKAI